MRRAGSVGRTAKPTSTLAPLDGPRTGARGPAQNPAARFAGTSGATTGGVKLAKTGAKVGTTSLRPTGARVDSAPAIPRSKIAQGSAVTAARKQPSEAFVSLDNEPTAVQAAPAATTPAVQEPTSPPKTTAAAKPVTPSRQHDEATPAPAAVESPPRAHAAPSSLASATSPASPSRPAPPKPDPSPKRPQPQATRAAPAPTAELKLPEVAGWPTLSADDTAFLDGNTLEPQGGEFVAAVPDTGYFACRRCRQPLMRAPSKRRLVGGYASFVSYIVPHLKCDIVVGKHETRLNVRCKKCNANIGMLAKDERAPTGDCLRANSRALWYVEKNPPPTSILPADSTFDANAGGSSDESESDGEDSFADEMDELDRYAEKW